MVVNIFQEQFEQIKEGGYSYILDVIYIFAMHNDYTTLIMNRYMYANLIDLCEVSNYKLLVYLSIIIPFLLDETRTNIAYHKPIYSI